MKKKLFLLVFSCLIFLITVLYFTHSYHYQLPMELGRGDTPITQIEIEGSLYYIDIDLGSKFGLSLKKEVLDKINNKKMHGTGSWKDVKGNEYVKPAYFIPKAKINNLPLKDIIAQEDENEPFATTTVFSEDTKGIPKTVGSIGRPLLKQKNLLLDYSHLTVLVSNDRHKLNSLGYNLDNYLKIPFEIGKIGITFKVDTDLGPKLMSLDTGCTVNLIKTRFFRNYVYPKEWPGLPLYTTHSFIVGENDLGPTDLYLYDITSELDEIDGFLGTPFLMKHVVYVDFANNILYIIPIAGNKFIF